MLGEGEEAAVEVFGLALEAKGVADVDWLNVARHRVPQRRGQADQRSLQSRARNKRAVDDIAWPAWDLIDVDTYNEHEFITGLHFGKTVPILATRGCPYQCTYCSSPTMWTTRWYARDPVDVVDEIEHYKKVYGATNFPFQDLTAILKKDWIVEFCNELLERQLDITWQFPSGTRCEVIDDEVADLLRRSGGKSLALRARERQRAHAQAHQEADEDRVAESTRCKLSASANRLNLTAFIVIGLPARHPDDLKRHQEAWCASLARGWASTTSRSASSSRSRTPSSTTS